MKLKASDMDLQAEYALCETFGRSAGEQWKQKEREYDADWQRFSSMRKMVRELEEELRVNSNEMAELYGVDASVVRPILMQYPLGLEMQDMANVVAAQLHRQPIILAVYQIGRQDFWQDETAKVFRTKLGNLKWANNPNGAIEDEESFANSYIAGWEHESRLSVSNPEARHRRASSLAHLN